MKLLHRLRLFQLNSLTVRLILFLLVALVPVGLIAVLQTRQVAIQASENAALSLLALTEQAARDERFAIEAAFSAAHALGAAAVLDISAPQECRQVLRNFLSQHVVYRTAALIPPSGRTVCSSSEMPADLTKRSDFASLIEAPRRLLDIQDPPDGQGGADREAVILSPVYWGNEFTGYIRLVLKMDSVVETTELFPDSGLVALATVTADGSVVAASVALDAVEMELPSGANMFDVIETRKGTYPTVNAVGQPRIYAVKPVVSDVLYAVGVWDKKQTVASFNPTFLPLTSFALLMWVASLLVAIFAVHNLVIRHVRRLGREMRRFASDRTIPSDDSTAEMPMEMQEMSDSFRQMATSIIHDEAALEASVREKKLLLKEVHHRVKNNLQLISSIVNMQIRKSGDEDTKFALRRVQERVLSLATIHRDLYEADEMGLVNGGKLLHEIIEHAFTVGGAAERGIESRMSVEDVWLIPDQAVPLSLFAAEAATNALKYVGAVEGAPQWVEVRLERTDAHCCELEISNSVSNETPQDGTGLGAQLIKAFATQLGGEALAEKTSGTYQVAIRFDIKSPPEPTDY